ncbi:MAG TPA: hypothetical protein VJ997_14850 [Longimicrobiales bacterium]|nr:hypothetical protein [Longimicrobiales bacterium]
MVARRVGVKLALATVTALGAAAHGLSAQEATVTTIRGSEGTWALPANARVGERDGRQVILLGRGSQVVRTDLDFSSGTIDFDLAADDATLFAGLVFRGAGTGDFENVYVRPYNSEEWNAVQYNPSLKGGSTWQLYPEFNAPAEIPRNRWIHIRVDVDGPRARFWVGDAAGPTLVVERLRADSRHGPVGFWATNGQSEEPTVAISNVVVRPRTVTTADAAWRAEPASGTLTAWSVSDPVDAPADGPVRWIPEARGFRDAWAEEDGLVNLTRVVGPPDGGRKTVVARTHVHADEARVVPVDLGYSDDVTVFVNGAPVYSGHGGWSARYEGFFGALRTGFETAWLPLRAGDNEVVLAVSDALPFGWGFKARLGEAEGVWPTQR